MMKEGIFRKGLVFTILIILVGTSIMSMASSLSLEKTSSRKTSIALKKSNGPAPEINQNNLISTAGKANNLDNIGSHISSVRGTTMYAYNVNASNLTNGPCYFDTEDPGNVTKLSEETVTNFLSGGTWTLDAKWYCCQYGTGMIYEISTDTGHITLIGGGGCNLNALAYNSLTNTLWGAGDTYLFQIDIDTGAQEVIGPFGSDVYYIIGMAFDSSGVLYGWDLGDKLWTINTSTGDATEVGPLGINLNYAQDGDFDKENGDILYLTAFTISPYYGGYLYTCDKETGYCTMVGPFESGAELDASMIQWCWCGHDVGVKDIISPKDGYANQDMKVIVKVQNYGEHSEENVPVNVVILKDGVDEEYNETMYIDIGYGKTVDVEMPSWTPSDWQSVSNEYIDYKITAHTDLYGDNNPDNDYKEKWFELYFGYFHDVGCTNVIGPESGPAQTFPVNVTIKNFGQYDECCFKTYVEIAELDINGSPILPPEYSDFTCASEIDAGQEINLTFDSWTPAYLAEETSGTKMYSVKAWTDLNDPQDENPDNDLFSKIIELDYFHDVGIKNIISPPFQRGLCEHQHWWYALNCSGDLVRWYPETGLMEYIASIGIDFPPGWTLVRDILWFCDTNGNIWTIDPSTVEYRYIGNAGTGELVGLSYHEKSKVMYGASSQYLYTINMQTGKATLVGPFNQLGYYMISIDCDRNGIMYGYDLNYDQSRTYKIDLNTGYATPLGFCGIGLMYGQDMDYDYDHGKMYACGFNYGTQQDEFYEINLETGHFNYLTTLPGSCYFFLFAIPYTFPERYVPLGSQDIEVIVENNGTFPELDLTCYAEIYEYITNCTNGTLVYEDNITDIDLDEPLGGTKILNFSSYNFATEGLYSLFLSIPDDDDDYPTNNDISLGIGADGTPPTSTHILSPVNPDGDNNWYVSDVTVTLNATDPSIGCDMDGSGVREIKYTINGVQGSVPGNTGTFKIHDDGTNIKVQYWAIDNVGNEETKHTFYINMDQTKPDIKPIEWDAYRKGLTWYVKFTCQADDVTSGMDRMEWATNDVTQNITTGPGPIYNWTIEWGYSPDPPTIKAIAYDKAGNSDFVKINGSDIKSHPIDQNNQQSSNNQNLLGNMLLKQMAKTSK